MERMRPSGAHHIAVVVRDLDRAESFYGRVLGLPVTQRWTDDAGAPRSVWLDLGGGAFLAIERAATGGPVRSDEAPGLHCVALRVEPADRERWRTRLADAGHPIERETAFTLYTRDPDGTLVGLSHYPAPWTG